VPGAQAAPFRLERRLTDNGSEFTDRLLGSYARAPSGQHAFDPLRQALGIEHRLTRPRRPQTTGMGEAFERGAKPPGRALQWPRR
jgi:transposase InsO family protein